MFHQQLKKTFKKAKKTKHTHKTIGLGSITKLRPSFPNSEFGNMWNYWFYLAKQWCLVENIGCAKQNYCFGVENNVFAEQNQMCCGKKKWFGKSHQASTKFSKTSGIWKFHYAKHFLLNIYVY